ncbi:MAG TPA: O-antigen ligase family protein [Methylophilaceae bacterium]|jgi:O-antigen ligase
MTSKNNLSKTSNFEIVNTFSLASHILFYSVLLKFSEIRIWPHIYAGDISSPNKLEFFIDKTPTVLSILLFLFHLSTLRAAFKKYFFIFLFPIFVFFLPFLPASGNTTPFFRALDYWEGMVAITLMFKYHGQEKMLQALTKFSLFFITVNLLSLLRPNISMMIDDFTGYFRGLTSHRNNLAQMSTVFLYVLLCSKERLSFQIRLLGMIGACTLIALAGSVQGVLLTLLGVMVYFYLTYQVYIRKLYLIMITFLIVVTFMFLVYTFSLDQILEPFGRDSSFTGRDRIWSLSRYMLEGMPWGGYGLGQISSGLISPEILLKFQLGSIFSSAHNSYLEAALSYGWIGFGLFMLAILSGFIKVISSYIISKNRVVSPLSLMVLAFCLIGGITSSEKLIFPEFGWFSFFIAVVLSDKQLFLKE